MNAGGVIDFLRSTGLDLPADAHAETSLLRSGLVDSLRLFALLDWIEQETGGAVDVLTLDLPDDWETPDAVAGYIERCATP